MKKAKRLLIYAIIAIISIPELAFADLEYVKCGSAIGIPRPIPQMTTMLYTMFMVGVPIVLIAASVLTMIKAIKSDNADEVLKAKDKLVKKFVAAGVIFLILSLTRFIVGQVTTNSDDKKSATSCIRCFLFYSNVNCLPSDTGNNVKRGYYYTEPDSDFTNDTKAAREEMARRLARRNAPSNSGNLSVEGANYKQRLDSMATPSDADLLSAASAIGLTSDYFKIVLGTTQNEWYINDPYLYYGWASAIINTKPSIMDMQPWDPDNYTPGSINPNNFYSQPNIDKGYNSATDDVKKSVYLAMTERNEKIIECNGMYNQTPLGYNLLYASTVYNCSIYETK